MRSGGIQEPRIQARESRLGLLGAASFAHLNPSRERGPGGDIGLLTQSHSSCWPHFSRLGLAWDRVVKRAVLISFDDDRRAAAQVGFGQPPMITAHTLLPPQVPIVDFPASSLDSRKPADFSAV